MLKILYFAVWDTIIVSILILCVKGCNNDFI